jgi:hypothetical protein
MNHQNKTNKLLITRLEQAFNHLPNAYGYTLMAQHASIVRETGYPKCMVYNSYLQFLNGRQRKDLNERDTLIICQFLDVVSSMDVHHFHQASNHNVEIPEISSTGNSTDANQKLNTKQTIVGQPQQKQSISVTVIGSNELEQQLPHKLHQQQEHDSMDYFLDNNVVSTAPADVTTMVMDIQDDFSGVGSEDDFSGVGGDAEMVLPCAMDKNLLMDTQLMMTQLFGYKKEKYDT